MARSDADKRTSGAECARCHTTWGFLNDEKRRPPEGTEPLGITCAACHAAHPASPNHEVAIGKCADRLLRDVPVPVLLEGAVAASSDRSRVCFGCHSPAERDGSPTATAAAIWAGRGGLVPASGSAVTGAALHGGIAGGCVGCHRSGPAELERGSGHAFRVTPKACEPCHASKRSDTELRARALRLWALGNPGPELAPGSHRAMHQTGTRIDRSTPRGRALWNVAVVLEDPAADAHNAAYARTLLDAAETVLGRGGTTAPAGSATP